MKGKKWLIRILAVCLLAGCCGAPAEETQYIGTAENRVLPESAAEEEEEPYVKPVADDPREENWARYMAEKILPALEPTLTKNTYAMTVLPTHGSQDGSITYGTEFQFSKPEEGAILGSMHVHFSGDGNGEGYQNAAFPFISRHFFPLMDYLIAGYQETALPISAEAIQAYSLKEEYSCLPASYFHQTYEGKDWQIVSLYFSGRHEDGSCYSLDGRQYILLVIQDLENLQTPGFCGTENYVIADRDMVEQIQNSMLIWEHLPEVISWKKGSLQQWFDERAAKEPENETGTESVAGEWKSVASYSQNTSILNGPLTMIMVRFSDDGSGTLSLSNRESEEISWEMNGNLVTIRYQADQTMYMVKAGDRLYLGAGDAAITTSHILVRPDDPLYYRVYRYGNESSPYDFSISTNGNPGEIAAGKNLVFKAEFEHPETVNQNAKNNQVRWNVSLADGSDVEEFATVNSKGRLTIRNELTERVQLVVRASSQGGSTADYWLVAVPGLKELKIEPEQAVLYLGESKGIELKITAEPAAAMPKNPQWEHKGRSLKFTRWEGKLYVNAAETGKTAVSVRDPLSGKSAKAVFTVLQPVTSVTVTGPGMVKAGKSATYKAALEPKTDIDKTVNWTVDVDKSIAAVTERGQLKVAKDAPAGTVIALTARAMGTENEVLDTIRITVE